MVPVPSRCPKCQQERRDGASSCPRCGLVVVRWERFAATAPPIDPVLDAPWASLEAAWADDAAHSRFLDAAAGADALDVAAAHYRRRRQADPDDARAAGGLERTLLLAQRIYQARAEAERTVPQSLKTMRVVGTLFAGLLLGAVVYILLKVMSHPGR
jgi:hypothetical protein